LENRILTLVFVDRDALDGDEKPRKDSGFGKRQYSHGVAVRSSCL